MKKAFTLIELLVVVLIIGILSAIALPRYQKAVERARMAEAVLFIKNVTQAFDLYRLENPRGQDFEALSISFPDPSYFDFDMMCEHPCWISVSPKKGNSYHLHAEDQDRDGVNKWTKTCYYTNSFGYEMCKSLEPNGYQVEGSFL